ncbi:MAG: FAD-binding protein [Deltaproteobacteria bacterium]|nr:FAD-binding protein [Deltaproteobacteria bacterium]
MGFRSFWVERARRAAERRRRVYGLVEPQALRRILDGPGRLPGFLTSLWLPLYVLVGSPRQLARLLWWTLTDRDTPARRRRIERLASELGKRLGPGCRILVDYLERRIYSRDVARVPRALEKTLHRTTPLLVVQPSSEKDVQAVLAFAALERLPVYPRGISSSPFGGAVPTTNGIAIDLSAMLEILEIDADRRLARVRPGARWADLASRLERVGLGPRTTPTSRFSTVGGWASTGGLGLGGFSGGHLSEAIAAARVALPTGEILSLAQGDDRLADFIGTEGQLGIFTELTLRVRELAKIDAPHLLYVDGVAEAFELVERLDRDGHGPMHVAYYDRERLAEEDLTLADRTGRDLRVFEDRDAILVVFDDAQAQARFLVSELGAGSRANGTAAHVLWSERYFPLKAQRLGPSLLASEVVMARRQVPRFVRRARRLARRFGTMLAIEVLVCRTTGADREPCVVMATFRCSSVHRWDYLLRLVLVQLLTRLAVRLGGSPYGFGIWNSPFLGRSAPRRRRMVRRKLEYDPLVILNPAKALGTRMRLGLSRVLFFGPVFRLGLFVLWALSPVLGSLARIIQPPRAPRWRVPDPAEEGGFRLVSETSVRCTFCGSCISTCPAYRLTRDELVTGRAKLRLAEAVIRGEELSAREAASPFQCLQCGLCEEVCQTRLPLRQTYAVIERWLADRHGYPKETVAAFVDLAQKHRARFMDAFGLLQPEWPGGEETK